MQYLSWTQLYEIRNILPFKKSIKSINTWRLNKILLYNQHITEEMKEELKKYLEKNDNENMTIQNPWEAAKQLYEERLLQYDVTPGNK